MEELTGAGAKVKCAGEAPFTRPILQIAGCNIMTSLRVALIGCGLVSEAHIYGYARHADRAKITVCCDRDPERAEQKAALAGGARVVTSVEQALDDPDVDAVEVCTPHHLHTDLVVAAAKAGKHILCQKPLAKTIAECDAMIAAAKDAGVVLYYGETNRTMDSAVLAKAVIAEGRIGQMVGLQATAAYWQGGVWLGTAWRYDPVVAGGGQLLDGGIHAIDVMINLGGAIESLTCAVTRFRPELGGEDTSILGVRFEGGQLGTLFSSHAVGSGIFGSACAVFGTEGALAMGGPHGALTLYRKDLPDGREVLLESWGNTFSAMIGRYLDTVLDGAPNPSPGESGRENLRVVLAGYEAAQTGREVTLRDWRPEEA